MSNKPVVIDLTHGIEEGMLTFTAPWHPPVSITQLGRIGLEGRETRKIELGTHTGTHMDAPRHFFKNGKTIDEIPLDRMQGEVTIADFSFLKDNEFVTKEMINNVNVTKRMIFKFGWGRYWGNKRFFTGWPFFRKDAAEYLISKGVELIAMDTPSPDDSRTPFGSEEDSQIHKLFLGNDVILVEYLANLESVKEYSGWNIAAIPLRINGADGSPARVFIYK